MKRRRGVLVAAACAVVLAGGITAVVLANPASGPLPTASASASAGPRALTTEESERLAVGRFLAYQDGSRTFRTEVSADGVVVQLEGRVDYRAGIGLASARAGDESAVITWNGATFVGWAEASVVDGIPVAAPSEPGGARRLDPSASRVDTVLALLLSLGGDRPENAQLLQQSDAAWLRADEVDGVPVDVFAGPSDADTGEGAGTVRYWVDDRGAVHRIEADLPSGGVVIELGIEEHVPIAAAPELG
ncbi:MULTISPECIES: hypothetical protein [unclassified Microbacterium]|uniref:hypothetical protein n=1 Tax=unclassified Microbacterium TaxID=2609290 RepID=UPI003447355F